MLSEEFLALYEREFVPYNRVHNISRLRDLRAEAADSLRVLQVADFTGAQVADIGSGAGFPALFLAAAVPSANFVLFEPNYKKAAFLSTIIIKAGLANARVVAKKVQDYALENPFDIMTSRAFAPAAVVRDLCAHLCTEQTKFLLFKGSYVASELADIGAHKLHEFTNRVILEFSAPSQNHREKTAQNPHRKGQS